LRNAPQAGATLDQFPDQPNSGASSQLREPRTDLRDACKAASKSVIQRLFDLLLRQDRRQIDDRARRPGRRNSVDRSDIYRRELESLMYTYAAVPYTAASGHGDLDRAFGYSCQSTKPSGCAMGCDRFSSGGQASGQKVLLPR
jgi:hypothetical protein